MVGQFSEDVYEIVRMIPAGKVATYGQIATLMGRPRAARYVGWALHANPRPGVGPDDIPCHRVVFKDGSLCAEEVFAGIGLQVELLVAEGVSFLEAPYGKTPRVNLAKCQWNAGV